MRIQRRRLALIVGAAFIFFAGLGAGLGAATLQDVLRGEGGLAFAARVAQLFPSLIDVRETGDIPSAGDLKPLSTFWEVREQIKRNFVHALSEEEQKELTYGALRGMLAALKDPYTRFMTAEEYGVFQTDTKGEFEGIGAQLWAVMDEKTGEQQIVVLSLIEGGPAADTDLKPKDIIIKVDGHSIKGLPIAAVAKRIRGKRGTKVMLTVVREGLDKPKDIEVTRERVEMPVVEYRMLQDKIGYVWLQTFNRQAEEKTRAAITDLEKQGMRGLILDLTGNTGGLLDMAIKVASVFVSGDNIVWIEERGRRARKLPSDGEPIDSDLPLVVLISHNSASASEILAGAIQDFGRGTIVGQKSFGKAKVQTVIPLNDGSALAVTTANYLTPKKRSVDQHGITPDRIIPEPPNAKDISVDELHEQQLQATVKIIKQKLAAAAPGSAAPVGG